jgi:transposase
LRPADEFELYCYRKSGVSIKHCAGMFRVSVPTAKRIIARFRAYDGHAEPLTREAREFRDTLRALIDAARGVEVVHG